jgi:hypothetical protein
LGGRKGFFFEKKKQKTFVHACGWGGGLQLRAWILCAGRDGLMPAAQGKEEVGI